MKTEKKIFPALRGILVPLCAVVAALAVLTAISNLSAGQGDEGRDQLERAVRRTAVTCYALEGVYPPTLAYMEEYYGLQVDTNRYTVQYTAFAENLMPEITVLEKED
ncbi:MAG: hypothetical protein LKJ86_09430 [Oscillibacter sp.]|jgi:hypothetical protein|nr:hypothetical protein [Oscillibacter sp.]